MQCLQVNISDRHTGANNGFSSALFRLDHVGNWDTELCLYSCNITYSSIRWTQAKKPHVNCRKVDACSNLCET